MTSSRPKAMVVLLHWPWPPDSGGRIRAVALVEALRIDYDVTVLAADHAESGNEAWDAAVRMVLARRASRSQRTRDIVEGALFGDHTAARRAVNAGLHAAFEMIATALKPDVVVLGPPFFGSFISRARSLGAIVVLDPNERLTGVARSLARARGVPRAARLRAMLESWTLDRLERREYPRADAIWVASEHERTHFRGLAPLDRVKYVPNPVLRFRDVGDLPIRAVAYVGWYGHSPNEAAALELAHQVMPAIRKAGGPERLVLIGRNPTEAMRRAAASNGPVEVTGEVPDALLELAEAGVLVMPIRSGGGTRVKVLEAAAFGVPMISTKLGVEGIDLEPDRHYLAAETADDFAQQVVRVIADQELRSRIVLEARRFVEERHGPKAILSAVRAALPQRADVSKAANRTSSEVNEA